MSFAPLAFKLFACDRSHRREQRATGVRPSPPDPATAAAAGGRIDTQVNARPGSPSPCAYKHAVAAPTTGRATNHAINNNRIVLRDARLQCPTRGSDDHKAMRVLD